MKLARSSRSRAFSLIDLQVVLGLIAVLLLIVWADRTGAANDGVDPGFFGLRPTTTGTSQPATTSRSDRPWQGPFGAARERGNRIKCAANLRGIGLALMLYGDQYKTYPMAGADGCQTPEQVYELLAAGGDLTPKLFICPSSNEPAPVGDKLVKSSFGFSSQSVATNKTWAVRSQKPGKHGIEDVPADIVIASDRRNGGGGDTAAKRAQSWNHLGDGQNALYGDCHAEFITSSYKHANSAGKEVTDDIFADEAIEPDTFIQD